MGGVKDDVGVKVENVPLPPASYILSSIEVDEPGPTNLRTEPDRLMAMMRASDPAALSSREPRRSARLGAKVRRHYA